MINEIWYVANISLNGEFIVFQSDAEQETEKDDAPASPVSPSGRQHSLRSHDEFIHIQQIRDMIQHGYCMDIIS